LILYSQYVILTSAHYYFLLLTTHPLYIISHRYLFLLEFVSYLLYILNSG